MVFVSFFTTSLQVVFANCPVGSGKGALVGQALCCLPVLRGQFTSEMEESE